MQSNLPTRPGVTIVIVCWNSAANLPRCLSHLILQTYKDFEVILIDNGSTDGSIDGIEEKYPALAIRIERLGRNLGFAAANNIGARLARGHWLALLNTDAFPEPDWLAQLIKATVDYPDFSCFSSRQIQADNPEFLDGTGDAYHVSGLAWRRNIGYPSDQFGLSPEEVFTPCAAAALYLRDAFLDVGGFDEDFFSYYEDVDLGFRLRLHGYRTLYVADAFVHHIGSATLGVNSDFSLYHTHRNLVWTFLKNMPTRLFLKYLPAHIMANSLYLLYYVIHKRGKLVWQAKWDALSRLPLILKKRRKIQNNRKVTDADLLRAMERGWLQPYRRGRQLRRILANQK